MMWIRSNTLHIVLVLLFLPKEYRGIKCYQCNSKTDKDCSLNTVDPKYLKPCPATHRYCRKYVYNYYFTNSREYSTTRECAKWRNAEQECYRGHFAADSYQLTCECKGSGCNHTSKSEPLTYLCFLTNLILFLLVNYT